MVSLTSGAALAKTLFQIAGASGVTVVRVGTGALLMALFWRPWKAKLTLTQGRAIVAYGICLGLMNLLFYFAIARLPIGIAIAIEFLGPLSIALLFSKRWLDLVWAVLAALGIALILPLSSFSAAIDPIGVLFALGAATTWAFYIVLGKRAGAVAPAGHVASVGMAVAFLTVAPFGLVSATHLFDDSSVVMMVLGVGLLSSALPYSFEMFALKQLPEKYFGLLLSLEPAIGTLIGFLFLRETLTPIQLAAIACVVAASVGSHWTHTQAPP
jgi:inner membrane transporter RhtA